MERALSDLMEFEHVIMVKDGVATDEFNPSDKGGKLWAPECIWNGWSGSGTTSELTSHIEPGTGWELLNGFSIQFRYSGPIMHPSEYIGGRMEDYILANDGYYAAVVCEDMECTDDCDPPGEDCSGHPPAGWAVAYRPLED